MAKVSSWESVSKDRLTCQLQEAECAKITYSLTALPDLSEPRFEYLAKEVDQRPAKAASRQLQMLRQLHGLGPSWALSMRIVKDRSLTLYLVFRKAQRQRVDTDDFQMESRFIKNALMVNEYHFEQCEDDAAAFDLSWAREAAEVYKQEGEYRGVDYPNGMPGQRFYVPFTWTAADNDMSHICDALMRHSGRACVEVTLIPTQYLDAEREWLGLNIDRLKNSMNGETLRNESGRVIFQGERLPGLRPAVDNCEKMNKQYEASRLFLSSIHVYADEGAGLLADALLTGSVKNPGVSKVAMRGGKHFARAEECYENVDITVEAFSEYWLRNLRKPDVPMRAQRLHRLVSVEEAASFFRIPLPVKAGFPGFDLDSGFGTKRKTSTRLFNLDVGRYLDTPGVSDTAVFDAQQLAKHGLIVGVPGSGKTTAVFSLLHQLWDRPEDERIPFIVLEPAKTEYRALKTLPAFADDMLVFTLGDEDASPFRFNPLEVLPGIRLESHISKLQACFVGAFDLFDPLPIFLEQAIRRTYLELGWYDDSRGGEPGLETPTISDLCRNASYIVEHSGFDPKMKSDFKASLLERLNSLRRGSKGRMLDCKKSVPIDDLMGRPVILELDSLNGDEKSLLMMFLLSYVFEYCKVRRTSGSPLRHLLVVEEAHNLISSDGAGPNNNRANPKAQTIELFVNMLAEMRALGQGILIADQLPTAIAPQAVKQTNVKFLMRVTAKDDREEIGSTMDLDEDQMHQVVNFKTGYTYIYHEGEDRVRMIRMPNFKGEHHVEEPPSDARLKELMSGYEMTHPELFLPYPECPSVCARCDRRVRNQAESFVRQELLNTGANIYRDFFGTSDEEQIKKHERATALCGVCLAMAKREAKRIANRYGDVGDSFGQCVCVHLWNLAEGAMARCSSTRGRSCSCCPEERERYMEKFGQLI